MGYVTCSFVLSILGLVPVSASLDEGYDIAKRGQEVLFNFQTLKVNGVMTLYRGTQSIGERNLLLVAHEAEKQVDFDKARISVERPTSLRGVQLLSWSNGIGDDQQWLYTPHTKRTRRIGDSGRKAAFVNSDFTFEDLLRWQLDAYRYEYLREESCEEAQCKVVEAHPTKRYSNYSKQTTWYDQEYRIRKVEYFDKRGNLAKVLTQKRYLFVSGETWQPQESEMEDLKKKTKTIILWSNYRLNESVPERIFEANFLGN